MYASLCAFRPVKERLLQASGGERYIPVLKDGSDGDATGVSKSRIGLRGHALEIELGVLHELCAAKITTLSLFILDIRIKTLTAVRIPW